MKKAFLLLLALLFIVQPVSATLGIGVQPSMIDIYLSDKQPEVYLPMKLWNEGTDDGVYTIVPDGNLTDFIVNDCSLEEYWCSERNYTLRNSTDRFENYKIIKLLFKKKTTGDRDVDTGIYIKGELLEAISGMLIIEPRVFARIHIYQYEGQEPPFTYSEPEPSGSSTPGSPALPEVVPTSRNKPTTTTTIETTTGTTIETTETTLLEETETGGTNNTEILMIAGGIVGVLIIIGVVYYIFTRY